MNVERYIFSQIMDFVPRKKWNEIAQKYGWDKRAKTFSPWEHFLSLSFAQLGGIESIRSLELCFSVHESKLYHLGFSGRSIARKTLHDANEKRNWKMFQEFAQYLMPRVQKLYTKEDSPFDFEIENPVYALDSTTINLCLNLFSWALFRKRKGAVKMHTLINLNGNIPNFICITTGKVHDVNILDSLEIEAFAFYIMDRGYLDFERLYTIHKTPAFFITRAKKNFCWKRRYSNPLTKEEKAMGIRCDQIIFLERKSMQKQYPEPLRRIKFFHEENQKYIVFLTNNFSFPAKHIVQMYKQRWQIELFFKWIKQHLEIQSFWGHSQNAVKTQIWLCVCVYLIVALIKKKIPIKNSLYEILQIFRISLLDKTPLLSLFQGDTLQISTGLFAQPTLELL